MIHSHAYTLENWPRRRHGDLIFTSTNEAIYYANLVDDRVAAYHYLEKWRKNTLENLAVYRDRKPVNYNRIMDLVFRGQFYREAMEEISRLNEEDENG